MTPEIAKSLLDTSEKTISMIVKPEMFTGDLAPLADDQFWKDLAPVINPHPPSIETDIISMYFSLDMYKVERLPEAAKRLPQHKDKLRLLWKLLVELDKQSVHGFRIQAPYLLRKPVRMPPPPKRKAA